MLREYGLVANLFRDCRILLQKISELFTQHRTHRTGDLGVSELLLGLTLELRIFDFDGDDCRESFSQILTRQIFIALFE